MRSDPFLILAFAAFTTACDRSSTDASQKSSVVASAEPVDVRIPLPAFQLVDEHGRRFDSADMRGKVWVVDFIFTSCPVICPSLTKKMAELVQKTESDSDIRFLSVSVDPENDTPAKLTSFVEKFGVVSPRWSLVTGDPKVVEDTVLRGFKVGMGKDSAGNLFHGEHFVLVDKDGRARGFFLANDEGTKALLEKARSLSH